MRADGTEHPTRVLVIEDNPIDVRMLQYALKNRPEWATEMTVAEDGEKAIGLLLRQGDSERPDLIVLDLNLPKRDGTEVLQVIRTSEDLRMLPVVILSSSPLDMIKDKVNGANVQADCYMTKPLDVDEFLALGEHLRHCYESCRRSSEEALK